MTRLLFVRVIVTFGPGTSRTSSVAPFSDFTTCPEAIIVFVIAPSPIRSVMSPCVPPPTRPGPAMIERIVPKRNAISKPVESLVVAEISEPASTTWPVPPVCDASTLP
jgi:hypothetical protein